MISVDQVKQELYRVRAQIPACAARCGQCGSDARMAANSLGVFGGEARTASACLSGAVNNLSNAQAALEQLDSGIRLAISELSQ